MLMHNNNKPEYTNPVPDSQRSTIDKNGAIGPRRSTIALYPDTTLRLRMIRDGFTVQNPWHRITMDQIINTLLNNSEWAADLQTKGENAENKPNTQNTQD